MAPGGTGYLACARFPIVGQSHFPEGEPWVKDAAERGGLVGDTILEIEGLRTWFHTEDGIVKAVDNIDLQLEVGRTLGVVGESGSGKSVTSLTVMGLLPEVVSDVKADKLAFLGKDLESVSAVDRRAMRGKDMAMIFQEPMTSLNPVFTVGNQVVEAIRLHEGSVLKKQNSGRSNSSTKLESLSQVSRFISIPMR